MKVKLTIGWKISALLGLMTLVAVINILIIGHHENSEKNDSLVINLAGYQRMLSQQITKLALGIANGGDENRLLLKERIQAYDSSLKVLQYGGIVKEDSFSPAPADLNALFEKNQQIWKTFKTNAQVVETENRLNPAYSKAISYIRTNNEDLLESIGKVVVSYETLPNASKFIHEINIAGRQRMLFQKIITCAFSMAAGEETEKERKKLEEVIQVFEYSNMILLDGGQSIPLGKKIKPAPIPAKILQKIYYKKWVGFRTQLQIILTQPRNNPLFLKSIQYLENNNGDLLDISHKVTDAFTDISIKKAFSLGIILNLMLGIDLFILVLGVLFANRISRPIKVLSETAKNLGAGDFNQEILNPHTNDEIEELSISFDMMIRDLKAATVSKNYLNNIIGSMMAALLVIDTDGKIIRVNNFSCKLLGYEEKEFLKLSLRDVAPYIFLDSILRQTLEESTISNLETRYQCKDGELIPICFSLSKMQDKEDRTIGVVMVGRDLTTQIKVEKALRQSEEKWRALAEHSPDFIMTLDLNGIILSINRVEEGFTGNDVIGNLMENYVPEKYKPVVKECFNEVIKTRKSGKYETEYISPDGSIKNFEAYVAPMIVFQEMVGFTVSARDITERKIAEKELQESKERYHTIFDQAADSIMLIEIETGKIVEFNDRAFQNLGYSRDEFWKLSIADFEVSQSAENIKMRIDKIGEEGAGKFETKHRTKSGDIRSVMVSAKVLTISGNKYILSIYHDYTELQHTQKKLEARQKEIEELNVNLEKRVQIELGLSRQKDAIMFQQSRLAAMGEMIGLIAHQWRQPLNALGLVLFNIYNDFDQNKLSEDSLNSYVDEGTKLTKKMSTTIDDFRNFFKPNKEKESFNINESIHSAISLVSANLNNDDISVKVKELEEISMVGFPNEYSQVILNIINNAKDVIISSEKENGLISIEITEENDFAVVKIQDNGGGIDINVIDEIFIPYYTTKEGGKGTGLGLYMSKIIIEDHMGGSLLAKNSGEGAEFQIMTPLNTEPGASI